MLKTIYTAKELADYLKVSERTILDLARGGKIPHYKVGKQWRFDPSEVWESLKPSTIAASHEAAPRFVADLSQVEWDD
tara:strand:- start:46 stop:279 length:234 start_codon:yes stop_codon:yes gene_type:complete